MRQAGKVGEPAADRLLVRRTLRHLGNGVIAGRGLAAAKIEHAVVGEDRADVGLRAGIGARRMAGDEVVDREPILDRSDPILDRALLRLRHAYFSRSDARVLQSCCHAGHGDARVRARIMELLWDVPRGRGRSNERCSRYCDVLLAFVTR